MSARRSGPGVVDQQAEQAAALGPVVDPGDLVLAQADRDELGQPPFPAVIVADDAERAVGRVHEADRGLDDPPEGGLQVQAGADGHDRLEQAAHPVPGRQHRLQPALQLGEELVELQVGKQLRATCGFHDEVLLVTMHRKDYRVPAAPTREEGGCYASRSYAGLIMAGRPSAPMPTMPRSRTRRPGSRPAICVRP